MKMASAADNINFANIASYRGAIAGTSQFPPKREELYGWDSTNPWFEYCIETTKPKLIVEVGTWLGASAIHMAKLCKKRGLDAKIICVDTWLGASEHYSNPDWSATLDFKFGYPQLYYGFLRNVIEADCFDMIVPLPLDTKSGSEVIAEHGLRPDLIYIDAGHSFDACLSDLRNYASVVDKTGIILGDDFRGTEVAKAVGAFLAGNAGWNLYVRDNKYLLSQRELADLADYRTTPILAGGHDEETAVTFARTRANFNKLRQLTLRKIISLKLRGRWSRFIDLVENDT